jgi:hypothetical protein
MEVPVFCCVDVKRKKGKLDLYLGSLMRGHLPQDVDEEGYKEEAKVMVEFEV